MNKSFEEAYKDSIKCEYPGTVEVDYGTEKIACVPMFFTYLHDDTHYSLFNILAFPLASNNTGAPVKLSTPSTTNVPGAT